MSDRLDIAEELRERSQLSNREIFRFWAPLALTWVMMSIEGPILTAVIARLPNEAYNLAAYGVAFVIALLVEAPVIMIMSAATALVKDRGSLAVMRTFTYGMNAAITAICIVVVIPPVFDWLALGVIELEPQVASLTHIGTALLIPWPAAIGFRRFWQGILIRDGLTRLVAVGTGIRLITMGGMAAVLALATDAHGVVVGTAALSTGVTAEAIAARIMVAGSLRKYASLEHPPGRPPTELTYRKALKFYYPLALTSIIGLGVQPVVTFFLGQARMPLESLAVLPVINGFVFLFRSFGMAWQEVGIALLGEKLEHYRELRNFTGYIMMATIGGLALVAFTPLAELWYGGVAGLKPALAHFAILPTQIMAILPGTTALLSFQRAVLVVTGRTNPISITTAIEVIAIIIVMYLAIAQLNAVGVVAAACALVVGRLLANGYITVPFLQQREQGAGSRV